jgi:predicted flap endonuclease-1-like 5' DNA nuclease
MTAILEVEGIGESYAKKLLKVGIKTVEKLLAEGATPKGRKGIADKAGIAESLVLEWVNHVDLFRIKGVASEYSDLLEEAGVDTVVELANRNPANLFKMMAETNQKKDLVRKMPTEAQVKDWVDQAKKLPRVVSY